MAIFRLKLLFFAPVPRFCRQGCPSYFNEADRIFYQAVENLQRATAAGDSVEQRAVAQEALRQLAQVPETLDLGLICRRFEAIRWGQNPA